MLVARDRLHRRLNVAGKNGTATRSNRNPAHHPKGQAAHEQICEQLADRRDVLGLLDHLEDKADPQAHGEAMSLSRLRRL